MLKSRSSHLYNVSLCQFPTRRNPNIITVQFNHGCRKKKDITFLPLTKSTWFQGVLILTIKLCLADSNNDDRHGKFSRLQEKSNISNRTVLSKERRTKKKTTLFKLWKSNQTRSAGQGLSHMDICIWVIIAASGGTGENIRMSSNKYCTAILESLVCAFIQCYEALLELFGGRGEICMNCMIQLRGPEVITGRDTETDVEVATRFAYWHGTEKGRYLKKKKKRNMELNTWFIKHDHFTSVNLYFINWMSFKWMCIDITDVRSG